MKMKTFTLCSFWLVVSMFASLTAGWNDEEEEEWRLMVNDGEVVDSSWYTLELTPAQQLLANVPASERGNFLLYQLALAINSGNFLDLETIHEVEMVEELDSNWLAAMANEFQHINVYDTFPMDLQNWLMDSYGLTVTDVYQSWRRNRIISSRTTGNGNRDNTRQQMCSADGQCYDMAQIVTVCCPF